MRAALALLALVAACGPARSALLAVTPTVPGVTPCADGAQRCNGLVPERCEGTRWYPLHPLGADLRPAPCAARCVVDGDPATAHCAGPVVDAGADAAEGGAS